MSKKKWWVAGEATLIVRKVVEAETKEDAIDFAEDFFGGLESYAGNGGNDKLVGVNRSDESCEVADGVDWQDAYELVDE